MVHYKFNKKVNFCRFRCVTTPITTVSWHVWMQTLHHSKMREWFQQACHDGDNILVLSQTTLKVYLDNVQWCPLTEVPVLCICGDDISVTGYKQKLVSRGSIEKELIALVATFYVFYIQTTTVAVNQQVVLQQQMQLAIKSSLTQPLCNCMNASLRLLP